MGRRVCLVSVVFVCCFIDLPAQMDMLCPCTNIFPSAYAHVRTEPLARYRPHSRKKKMAGGIPGFRMELCCFSHPPTWPIGVFCGSSVLFLVLGHSHNDT